MTQPGVCVCTVHNPCSYSYAQIEQACAIAFRLDRGEFVLTARPARDCAETVGEDGCDLCLRLKEQADA